MKTTPVKTPSGDLLLTPSKTDRYQLLFIVLSFQCLLLVMAFQGIRLIVTGNLMGILLVVCFCIPGTAIIWFNYRQKTRLAFKVFIDAKNRRIEITPPSPSDGAAARKPNQKSDCFPFDDIDAVAFLPPISGLHVVQIRINGRKEAVNLCSLPMLQARHLIRHISGLTGCDIQTQPGEMQLSPLPPDAVWDPDSEKKPLPLRPGSFPFPAIIFCLLVLSAAIFKYFDPRPPVWFYLGIHFQAALSVAGPLFLFKGRDMLTDAWDRMKFFFLFLLSVFLLLSLYLPSRGLFLLLFGCIALLTPITSILKSSSVDAKHVITRKKLLLMAVGTIISAPFLWYGSLASKEVYDFFSQPLNNISAIAFYKIKPPRHPEKMPSAIIRHYDEIQDIMEILGQSVSQQDPRRVSRHYLMRISHADGASRFATIGKMKNGQGCILFSSRCGLWGWEFGGYDNAAMISVLSRYPGLWPKPAKPEAVSN